MRDYLAENAVYLVGVREYAAATVFGGDAPHGAADVPVNLVVANLVEPVGEFDKFHRFFAQNLRNHGYGIAVGLGQHVVDLIPCFGQIAMGKG